MEERWKKSGARGAILFKGIARARARARARAPPKNHFKIDCKNFTLFCCFWCGWGPGLGAWCRGLAGGLPGWRGLAGGRGWAWEGLAGGRSGWGARPGSFIFSSEHVGPPKTSKLLVLLLLRLIHFFLLFLLRLCFFLCSDCAFSGAVFDPIVLFFCAVCSAFSGAVFAPIVLFLVL